MYELINMKRVLQYIFIEAICLLSLFLSVGCSKEAAVMDDAENALVRIELKFDTAEYVYDGKEVIGTSSADIAGNVANGDCVRYIVRVYPASKIPTRKNCIKEIVLNRNISDGYEFGFDMEIVPGNYDIMVWSDIVTNGMPTYDAEDFTEIVLSGNHDGNNASAYAYRGRATVSSSDFSAEESPATIEITMQRPLAKFEMVANDLLQFIERESEKMSDGETDALTVNLDDYTVVFYYVGFMPDTYSFYKDRPVDSSTGVCFESKINVLNDYEASLGFDYVFVNEKESAVTVRVGIYDKKNELVALTSSIKVPLMRGHHTLLRNAYLSAKKTDGIIIDTGYNGNFNLIFK